MLWNVSDLIPSNSFYGMHDEWPDLDRFCFQKESLPLVISTLPELVTKALYIVQTPLPQLELTEIDDDENGLIRPE